MAVTYANRDPTDNGQPARGWMILQGFVLLAVAVLGLFAPVADALHNLRFHIEGGEDAIHWVLGIAALVVGFAVRNARAVALVAIVYGVTYLLVGVLGFFVNDIGPWHVALGDNLLHLALGAVSLAVGLATQRRTVTGRTTVRRSTA